MAFFDEIGKRLSQAGQTAIQKTKDMTDVARINGVISEEEKKVNNNYYQIGKLYVAKHSTNYEDEFEGMMSAIRESEAKICECRQQIQAIKGTVCCEKCGEEVPSEAAFCSSCGASMLTTAENNVELRKCAGCGAIVDKNMKFCTACGRQMSEVE